MVRKVATASWARPGFRRWRQHCHPIVPCLRDSNWLESHNPLVTLFLILLLLFCGHRATTLVGCILVIRHGRTRTPTTHWDVSHGNDIVHPSSSTTCLYLAAVLPSHLFSRRRVPGSRVKSGESRLLAVTISTWYVSSYKTCTGWVNGRSSSSLRGVLSGGVWIRRRCWRSVAVVLRSTFGIRLETSSIVASMPRLLYKNTTRVSA